MAEVYRQLKAATILRHIGAGEALQLHNGKGYWYFEYNDQSNNIYELRTVTVYRLSDLPLSQWIEEGQQLVKLCKDKIEARAPEQWFVIEQFSEPRGGVWIRYGMSYYMSRVQADKSADMLRQHYPKSKFRVMLFDAHKHQR